MRLTHDRFRRPRTTIRGVPFATARAAIRKATGGKRAITVDGKNLVVTEAEAERLAAAGISFAYLCDHRMPDGTRRIMTVPVN
jgi:hypothetical protein